MAMNITVAITGMNSQPDNPGPGMAVARCLKESSEFNGRIVGLGYDALDAGIYHNEYCDTGYLLPYPSSENFEHVERLKEIHEKEGIDILIPCLDSELAGMVNLTPLFEELGIKTYLPSFEQLVCRNKDRLPELVGSGKMICPESINISSSQFFSGCEKKGWDYPLVVKGVFYDAKIVFTAAQGIAAFQSIAAQWGFPVIVQKFVAGEEYSVTALGDGEGNVAGMVMMKKMSLTEKGKASAGISIYDEGLLQACLEIIKTLQWKGPLEIEVMRDRQGQYHLIEINPRFPAWVYLTEGVGQNLPIVLLKLIAGEPVSESPSTNAGVLFIRHAMDFIVPIAAFEAVAIEGRTR